VGEEQAVTSVLTLDEELWEVKKTSWIRETLETAEAMLNFQNLENVTAN